MGEAGSTVSGSAVRSPAAAAAVLCLLAVLLTAGNLARELEPALWWQALAHPHPDDMRELVFHYAAMPRLAVALLAGATLAFAGAILQQALANPLAEPGTLGISAGSYLALAVILLAAPGTGPAGRELAALGGALVAVLFVLGLAARRGGSPLTLILAGLVAGLACSVAGNVLLLFNHRYLTNLFVWGSGALQQNDWSVVASLAAKVVLTALPILLLLRPLILLGIDGGAAWALGLSPAVTRSAAVALAAALAAYVTVSVGVIAFIGLAAPALARLTGARTLPQQLLWAPVIGAALLALADAAVLAATPLVGAVPTGAATALLGAPLLILLGRGSLRRGLPQPAEPAERRRGIARLFAAVAVAFMLAVVVASMLGRTGAGWRWADLAGLEALLPWRAPRVGAAMGCGAILAVGGVIMQRLLRNPMAAPELTGVSAGAACGVILALLLTSDAGRLTQMAAGTCGALAVLAAMAAIGLRTAFAPERLLLAGVAMTTGLSAFVSVLLATGDPRLADLITWMAGSTYGAGPTEAALSLGTAAALVATLPFLARWLEIVPLGDDTARALGIGLSHCRAILMLVSAAAAAVATLIIGPLTFVGLLAPHLVRALGVHRALPQALLAALTGATIMVLADWIGRQAAFPRQIPAGLMATAVGSPVLLWLLWRGGRTSA
ncbi:Fe(3+)-hydroxamate ABC transporter permease FhuB [Pseudochelatococcus sp. B33]